MDSYIEIKKNATGHYYFTYRYDDTFMAVSSSFSSRSSLESHLSALRLQAPKASTFLNEENGVSPCFVVYSRFKTLYRFEFLYHNRQSLIQSEYCSSLECCLEYIQIFSNTIADIRIIDNSMIS